MIKASVTITLLVLSVMILSWLPNPAWPGSHPLLQEIPQGFPDPVYRFTNNPLTQEGFELGRELFYDGRLSKDGTTACASCHQQHAAFADYQHVFSHGVNSAFTLRNAPPLQNLAWYKDFHQDGAINHLEVQPLAPISGTTEMANSLDTVLLRLQRDTMYIRMFRQAFGEDKITGQRLLKAIAQFTGSLVSGNSRYDRMKRGQLQYNEFELRGYAIFKNRCASCHQEPLLTDGSFRNTGLPVDTFLYDYGRMRITGDRKDSLFFKVPSLRNIALTAPYLHDGRYWGMTIASDHAGNRNPADTTADPLILNQAPLTVNEKIYIASFLHTLTDSAFLKNQRFADATGNRNTHQ